jgi:hypothetical protein
MDLTELVSFLGFTYRHPQGPGGHAHRGAGGVAAVAPRGPHQPWGCVDGGVGAGQRWQGPIRSSGAFRMKYLTS